MSTAKVEVDITALRALVEVALRPHASDHRGDRGCGACDADQALHEEISPPVVAAFLTVVAAGQRALDDVESLEHGEEWWHRLRDALVPFGEAGEGEDGTESTAPNVDVLALLSSLDAVEARAEAASSGPWVARLAPPAGSAHQEGFSEIHGPAFGVVLCCDSNSCGPIPEVADADFLAHARSDVPALVAAVRMFSEVSRKLVDANWPGIADEEMTGEIGLSSQEAAVLRACLRKLP